MKANDGSGNIPDRDEWETPKELFNKLYNQYKFDFDCCANDDNKKTQFRSDDFIGVKQGVAIYRCDNLETYLWQDLILLYCDWIFIPKGRVVYEGMNGSGSRFPSALIGVGVKPPNNLNGRLLFCKGFNKGKNHV